MVNGLGDRAGNCSFEEAVMALEGLYRIDTGIKTEKLFHLCKTFERMSGVKIPPNKAICGGSTFVHESDIHVREVLTGNAAAFEPYEPSLVGQERTIWFGSTTSTDSVELLGKNMGLTLSNANIQDVMGKIKGKIKEKGYATEDEVRAFISSVK